MAEIKLETLWMVHAHPPLSRPIFHPRLSREHPEQAIHSRHYDFLCSEPLGLGDGSQSVIVPTLSFGSGMLPKAHALKFGIQGSGI